MLLVKGKVGKSVILELIHKNTKSLTFIYYSQPVIDGGLWVNSDTMTFTDFVGDVSNYMETYRDEIDGQYEYLIIYSNQGEKPMKYRKDMFEKWEKEYGFSVIVGCK